MSGLVGYLLLFLAVSIGFVFIHLVIGRFVRPYRPDPEKMTIYECGEPTIGSAWVQFDLRFYVVALLFVVFDVEVAFFFPWAVVFGQANALAKPEGATAGQVALAERELLQLPTYERKVRQIFEDQKEKDVEAKVSLAVAAERRRAADAAPQFAVVALVDILVFFAVLLVGFAYLWARGDLKWVRALAERGPLETAPSPPPAPMVTAPVERPVAHAAH